MHKTATGKATNTWKNTDLRPSLAGLALVLFCFTCFKGDNACDNLQSWKVGIVLTLEMILKSLIVFHHRQFLKNRVVGPDIRK